MSTGERRIVFGRDLPRFGRDFFGSPEPISAVGRDAIGGKGSGLVLIRDLLRARAEGGEFPAGFGVSIPKVVVICTDTFDAFMDRNGLRGAALLTESDRRIAAAFQAAELPTEIVGDLRGLIEKVHAPLAIRSSSLLEDAESEPFAGVYGTKMVPNNQADPDVRFRKLVEAIKFVYASTYLRGARDYATATGHRVEDEKMAVLVQEVVGRRHGPRHYPELSGVARSWNFYPVGGARPEDGVVSLALGLGKTIVDGGVCWAYSPSRPRVGPPFASASDMARKTQGSFWAVNMGRPPAFDPILETEYLAEAGLDDAETDGTLRLLASTYDARSDRVSPGTGGSGVRVLNFAPLLVLEQYPLNALVKSLLATGEQALGAPVEIEFAATFPDRGDEPCRFGFLQVRAMAVSTQEVEVSEADLGSDGVLVGSRSTMGNGVIETIRDIVYVDPERFETRHTVAIASEIEQANRALLEAGRRCLLIGFGRWGSTDRWLGIPVEWPQISAAAAIVEATLPAMDVDPSQGSHFFHNMTSFGVVYLQVPHGSRPGIDWAWLAARPAARSWEFVRHVALDRPIGIRVDGQARRGVIVRESAGARGRGADRASGGPDRGSPEPGRS